MSYVEQIVWEHILVDQKSELDVIFAYSTSWLEGTWPKGQVAALKGLPIALGWEAVTLRVF